MRILLPLLIVASLGCGHAPTAPATPSTATPSTAPIIEPVCALHWRHREAAGDAAWCARADGQKDGQFRRWWPDGSRRVSGLYASGERIGRWIEWTADGRVRRDGYFERGQRHGSWTFWGRHGAGEWPHFHHPQVESHLVSRGAYRHGRPDGRWTFRCQPPRWDPKSAPHALRCEAVYVDGRQVEWAIIRLDGRTERLVLSADRLTHLLRAPGHARPDVTVYGGRPAEWVPGQSARWGADWAGWPGVIPDGLTERFRPDGRPLERGVWRKGQRHGWFRVWDDAGRMRQVEYRFGQRVVPRIATQTPSPAADRDRTVRSR